MPTELKILETKHSTKMVAHTVLHRRSTAQFVHRVKRLPSNRCSAIFILRQREKRQCGCRMHQADSVCRRHGPHRYRDRAELPT